MIVHTLASAIEEAQRTEPNPLKAILKVWFEHNELFLDYEKLNTARDNERLLESRCYWSETEHGWETDCKNIFVLNDGTPSEHNLKFCPYCRGHLMELCGEEVER